MFKQDEFSVFSLVYARRFETFVDERHHISACLLLLLLWKREYKGWQVIKSDLFSLVLEEFWHMPEEQAYL